MDLINKIIDFLDYPLIQMGFIMVFCGVMKIFYTGFDLVEFMSVFAVFLLLTIRQKL